MWSTHSLRIRDLVAEKLHGKLKAFHRMDSGKYRVVYEIHDNVLTVIVVKVGDRRDVYK